MSNDLHHRIPVEDMLCLLDLSARARGKMQKWCEEEQITQLSLFGLMDMLLPFVAITLEHYELMPAYKVKGLGQKLYAELIKAVTAIGCGDACQKEWSRRKKNLVQHLRAQGGFYPYIHHGRGAALDG